MITLNKKTINYKKFVTALMVFTIMITAISFFNQSKKNVSAITVVPDPAFLSGTGFSGTLPFVVGYPGVIDLEEEDTGTIMVGGSFDQYNGSPVNGIARLNSNGTLNTSFNPGGLGVDGTVREITIQPDGKILLGGTFLKYNGTNVFRFVRLEQDGSIDATFLASGCSGLFCNFSSGNTVNTIVVQPDGKIIIGGDFADYTGIISDSIVRLNSDGTVDSSFVVGTGFSSGEVYDIELQPDGKMIVVGEFTQYNGSSVSNIVRLNSDGTIDPTFTTETSGLMGGYIHDIEKVGASFVLGGSFTSYNGVVANRIVKITATGSLDGLFVTGTGFDNIVYQIKKTVQNQLYVVGEFTQYNGSTVNGITVLNNDGQIENLYDFGSGFNNRTYSVIPKGSGKTIVGGSFTNFNAISQGFITRFENATNEDDKLVLTTPVTTVTAPFTVTIHRYSEYYGPANNTAIDGATLSISDITLCGGSASFSNLSGPDTFGNYTFTATPLAYGSICITVGDGQVYNINNVEYTDNKQVTVYYPAPAPPTVVINGPLGITTIGTNTITGTCTEIGQPVTIVGTGFNPPSGTTTCSPSGTYNFPISIEGNTQFTASQTNVYGIGTANGATTLPVTSGGSGGGGCFPGYSCDTTNTPAVTPIIQTVSQPTPLSPLTNTCPQFTEYLKKGMRDGRNGVSEISKVQSFLNRKLGLSLITDGIFGKNTYRAVAQFQSQHFNQVLAPWGLTNPTGWWYQSTRSYANFLENCSEGVVQLDNTVRIQDGIVI